ncbi:MAG TPA: Glu-tRNA(Gln) amidotransferase subunit GatE [Candidatus Bathyarchaeia archaeon]|nr:MAG: glutamyl-tRNA(Gln) amidotransferase subunit E [Candidatus Bathyarchaeota archaeon RBG_16_48_13]HJX23034.1 Glu-tRNA(Gln) amidotransferase subunit GatE [Candidatus Bathyarchaeia archaeon]
MVKSEDYIGMGLKVGLEVHQQLRTKHKLFCGCPPDLTTTESLFNFYRKLRPAQSELGQFDSASFFEFKKGRGYIYDADPRSSCLVEMDEEPPHTLNGEAVDTCVTVALLLGADVFDEIHVMRKIVTDGSNTSGFQRTSIISLGGKLEADGREYTLQTICLEEDAARLIETTSTTTHYNLDRLGVPLIEIATEPVIHSPEEAEKVALALGRLIRATGKARRGLGTIRQDVNVSIRNGALIEIKGVQELDLIPKVVEYEALRQLTLLEIQGEMTRRSTKEIVAKKYVDVSRIFQATQCKVLKSCLERKGKILALKLPGFAGLLGRELEPGVRLGTEMADRAKFWGKVGGIFHTDELPAYGISSEEVRRVKDEMVATDLDAIILVGDDVPSARDALDAVFERALEALRGVPEETRRAMPDGTTRYMRPRPGAARMYPETDIPIVTLGAEKVRTLRGNLPELPEKKLQRLMKQYGLNEKLVRQLVNSDYVETFEIVSATTKVSPSVIAANLTETLKSLKREGYEVEKIDDDQIAEAFQLADRGLLTKEALPEVFMWLAANMGNARDAIQALGLGILSETDLEEIIEHVLEKNVNLTKREGEAALRPLLGLVMKEVRGKAEASHVTELLKEKLSKRT